MSKLKLSPNLFLEVNELNRFRRFLEDDGYKRVVKSMVKSYGIVEDSTNSGFKVTKKPGTNNTIVINKGLAFDTNLDGIVMSSDLEMEIVNNGEKHWLILSRNTTNWEDGTISVNQDGSITGVGTEFLSVLRGQPNFPTKIKLDSLNNTGSYEVVSVNSDTSALISGSVVAENGIKYSVIGTFTPGFQPLSVDELIYEYDSYSINIVESDSRPAVSENEFILSCVTFDELNEMNVSDERINYMFNNPYLQNYDENSTTDDIASLIRVDLLSKCSSGVDSITVGLTLEFGYTITRFELIRTTSSNVFSILDGSCNFLGTGNIPDNMFNGWLLLNKKNMKYAMITKNVNKNIYINNLDTSIIEDSDNEFVIVPNFDEIEFEVKLSNNVTNSQIPFFFKSSIEDVFSRYSFNIFLGSQDVSYDNSVDVKIRYRLVDYSGRKFPYSELSLAQFINIQGNSETLSNSDFSINLQNI